MLQLRISLQLASLRQPLKKALQTAAQLGVNAVEIDARNEIQLRDMSRTAVRHLRKMLEDLNLSLSGLAFPTRRGFNELADLDQRVEATMRAMTLAYDLGAPMVTNQVGDIPENEESATWNLLVETLTTLGQHGQKCGARFAARTGAEDGATLNRLVRALPVGALAVDFDPGELTLHRFSPSEAIKLLADDVIHVRARDAVQDLAQRRGVEVQLGRGSVDFPELLGELENAGYRGYLTLERRQAQDPVLELSQGIQFLRNLFA